jgi:hypothetical protein
VRANRELDFRNRSYYGPAYASAEALGLGTPGSSLRDYGPGYKERELAAGAAAERFVRVLVSLDNKVLQIALINRSYLVLLN